MGVGLGDGGASKRTEGLSFGDGEGFVILGFGDAIIEKVAEDAVG